MVYRASCQIFRSRRWCPTNNLVKRITRLPEAAGDKDSSMGKQKNGPARTIASTTLDVLPRNAVQAIETEVEREFFLRAMDVMRDSRWAHYSRSPTVRLRAVADLTAAYTDLLAWAFVEYVDRLARLIAAAKMRSAWSKIEENAFQFVSRFPHRSSSNLAVGSALTASRIFACCSPNRGFRKLLYLGRYFTR